MFLSCSEFLSLHQAAISWYRWCAFLDLMAVNPVKTRDDFLLVKSRRSLPDLLSGICKVYKYVRLSIFARRSSLLVNNAKASSISNLPPWCNGYLKNVIFIFPLNKRISYIWVYVNKKIKIWGLGFLMPEPDISYRPELVLWNIFVFRKQDG